MKKIIGIGALGFGMLIMMSCNSSDSSNQEIKEEVIKTVEEVKPEKSYKELGLELAMTTKGIVGKNLMGTIQKEGTDAALAFCNVNADVLIDSMSTELNASIRRVTDKPRNINNKANKDELAYIEAAKLLLANGEKILPQMQDLNDKVIGYYPIVTNAMCMQCHGEPETQIKSTTMNKINTLYPNDLAKGYAENQLRGIWVVEMNKK